MPDDPDDALPEQTIRGDAVRFAQQGGIVVTGNNARVFQGTGYAASRGRHMPVDPRQRFLKQVRALALKDAARFSLLSLIFMAAGAAILLGGGVLALMHHGASTGPSTALMTSLGAS